MMRRCAYTILAMAAAVVSSWYPLGQALADDITVEMKKLTPEGTGDAVGTIRLYDSEFMDGLIIDPSLSGLPPGPHGFHMHENPSCAPSRDDGEVVPGGGAGDHFDPEGTGRHAGPYAKGHLGDLPAIWAGPTGEARTPVFAPRLTVEKVRGHALILHAGGDNYSDQPEKLGGGGGRIACGAVQ